jgi:hypothetical protein
MEKPVNTVKTLRKHPLIELLRHNKGNARTLIIMEPLWGMEPDTLYYMTTDIMDSCKVYNYETGKYTGIYDMEKRDSYDPYEMFLSGAVPLLTIENPKAETKKELVIFRDSFGSSIAPLFIEAYSKVTLVDIRYITSDYLGSLITFDNQDVLFLYSTLVLNNSSMLK